MKVTVENEGQQTSNQAPFSLVNRKCRDLPFLIFFLIYLGAMGIVANSAISNGDPKKLVIPQDQYNNYCGYDNTALNTSYPVQTANPYLYYVDPVALTAGTYICVSSCPNNTAIITDYTQAICRYDQVAGLTAATFPVLVGKGLCSGYTYASSSILNRCIPSTAISSAILNTTSSGNTTISTASVLNAGKSQVLQALSDISTTWPVIVACVGGSLILSLLWMGLLQWTASIFIWVTIILSNAAFMFSSVWLYFFWSQCAANTAGTGSSYMANTGIFRTILNTLGINSTTAVTSSTVTYLQVAFIVVAVITALLLLITIGMARRIAMAVAVLKQASRAMMKMPLIILFPFLITTIMGAWMLYFVWILLYIITPKSTNASLFVGTASWTDPNVSNLELGVHIFGFFWTLFFLSGINQVTIAGAIGSWYWSKDKRVPRFPVLRSMYRTFRYHLGSIAVGSLLIAIVEFIRVVLYQLQRKAQKSGIKAIQYILACLQCCMKCISVLVKFVNRNAYIIVAITGKAFFKSAGHATGLLLKNALKVVAVDFVSVVTAITSVVCYIYLTSNTTLYSGVVYPQVSVALVALGSFMVASAFFSVYGMAVDTIFLCFLEDLDHNDGSTERPYYMPDGLASVMGINKAKIINQQAVSQTSQVSSPAAASSVKGGKKKVYIAEF